MRAIVPLTVIGRASSTGLGVMLGVTPLLTVNAPLPVTVPPLHEELPPRATLPVPPNVPDDIVSEGSVCVVALLTFSVPPAIVTGAEIVPLTVMLPLATVTVPAPVIDDALSNVLVPP